MGMQNRGNGSRNKSARGTRKCKLSSRSRGKWWRFNKYLCTRDFSRENRCVQIRFLLGPAGSGKTFRCLAEIRDALTASPEGLPLILLAPKQATFQLERQLLADDSLCVYTRLRILSFERLAHFIFDQLGEPPPKMLDE